MLCGEFQAICVIFERICILYPVIPAEAQWFEPTALHPHRFVSFNWPCPLSPQPRACPRGWIVGNWCLHRLKPPIDCDKCIVLETCLCLLNDCCLFALNMNGDFLIVYQSNFESKMCYKRYIELDSWLVEMWALHIIIFGWKIFTSISIYKLTDAFARSCK